MTDLERTAFHEAGHAVVSYALRVPIAQVTVVPSGSAAGSISRGTTLEKYLGDLDLYDPRARRKMEKLVRVLAAGFFAEWRASGRKHVAGSAGDFKDQVDYALHLRGDGDGASDEIASASMEVKAILSRHWSAVKALAHALLVKQTMSGRTVRNLIRKEVARRAPAK